MPVAKTPTDEKKNWLRQYLARPENLSKTHDQVRQACREQFGEALGTAPLNAIIKEVRTSLAAAAANGKKAYPAPSAAPEAPRPRITNHVPENPAQILVRELVVMSQLTEGRMPVRDAVAVMKVAMEACGIQSIRITDEGKVEVEFVIRSI